MPLISIGMISTPIATILLGICRFINRFLTVSAWVFEILYDVLCFQIRKGKDSFFHHDTVGNLIHYRCGGNSMNLAFFYTLKKISARKVKSGVSREVINKDICSILYVREKQSYASSGRNSGERAISSIVLSSSPLSMPLEALAALSVLSRIIFTFSCSFRARVSNGFKTPSSYIASIVLGIILSSLKTNLNNIKKPFMSQGGDVMG